MAPAVAADGLAQGWHAMSVVNRMLQDIDRRRTVAGIDLAGLHADIRSVAPAPRRAARSGRPVLLVVLLIGAAAAAAIVWRGWRAGELPMAVPATMAASQAPLTVGASSTPASPPVVPPPAQAVVTPAPHPVAATEPIAVVAGTVEKPSVDPPLARRKSALASTEMLKLSLQLSALVAERPVARSPVIGRPVVSTGAPGTTSMADVPVRSVAADETVLAARALWNDGSRSGALTTLREALSAAEKSRNPRTTASLARELAGLEVADNRAQVALDLLRRLEPLFNEDADAWALRGNAEQRLAMHAEAAGSYLAALRLRPTEGKWMLGAAISLAATGKLEEAQNWVERARERDAVTPLISAYLQQLGLAARR